jgi:hypothetical protein
MTRILATLAVLALSAGAALAGDLPDPALTPGMIRNLSLAQICKTKWGHDQRAVTQSMKAQVVVMYHFSPAQCPSHNVEIDHLISRELGGADDVRNLWPQCFEKPVAGKTPSEVAEFGAHKKDRLENWLHKQTCAGKMTLKAAQDALRRDWIAAYRKAFGP